MRRYRRDRQQRLRCGEENQRPQAPSPDRYPGAAFGVHVGPASVQDRDGAKVVFCLFCRLFLSVSLIFADGGYQGKLEAWVRQLGTLFGHRGLALEIIKRSDQAKGFELLPRRWVVERTFGWLMKSRRLTRDHERNPRHHEAFV